MAGRQPNVLVLMVDQLNPSALPAYGHKVTKTPHLDALAAQAVVFDAAYCNSPLCAPARAVFMSGQLASRIGAYDNAAEFGAQVPTFAHYLRRAGYRTILAGKMHFCGPDQLHGFEQRLTTDIYPADFGWTPDWENFGTRPSWYHNMSSVTEAGPSIRTNQLDYDEEVVFAAQRKLYDLARSDAARPFCMVVSLSHPHDPFTITDEYWNLYRDEDIELPRVTIPVDKLDPHSRRLRHVCNQDAEPVTEEQIRAARRAYYGAISFVDAQVGRLMRTLRDVRLADDTIVLFLGDHGEMLGERGLWYKMNFFEGGSRVPLMISAPKRFAPRRVPNAVSLVDILPTLVDLAHDGAAPAYPAPIDGHSLLPHLEGKEGHDLVLGEYLAEGAIAPIVMVRRGRHKFVHCPADPDMLFDLESDPDELHNLAREPGAADLVRRFRAEVDATWDLRRLHADVLASQRRRLFLAEAMQVGEQHPWDHQPFEDASRRYMRNSIDLDDLERMARFPPVRGAEHQRPEPIGSP
jgi:choline-sulfatase